MTIDCPCGIMSVIQDDHIGKFDKITCCCGKEHDIQR